MKMQSPVKNLSPRKNQQLSTSITLVLGLTLSFCGSSAYALNWAITPTLQLQEVYSDNIRLASSGNEKSAFVTQLNPGVFVNAQSGMSQMSLNYRLQNLYNANGDGDFKTANQLQYSSSTTLIPNKLFLNSSSSISQQNMTANRIATDNIAGSNNSTTISTFNIAPQWRPHFANYADGLVSVNFNTVTSSNNASTNSAYNFSDSASLVENIQLSSGNVFKRVRWSASFSNNESYRKGGNNVSFQNLTATLTTYLNRNFNVFATIGQSSNSFQTITNSNNNGFFYTLGAQWSPSKRYSITAGVGNNNYITISMAPTQRLTWVTTYRDNSVGLNSGQTWQTALNYQTRRSMWSLSHNNDTTTTQAILLEQRIFNAQDSFGNIIVDPATNQPAQFAINIPTLTNQVIVRQKWDLAVSFFTGKSVITASAFDEKRNYQSTGSGEEVRGINGAWTWQVGRKTSFYLRSQWQQTNGDGVNTSASNHYDIAIGLSRPISTRINANLELRHVEQNYNNQGGNRPLDLLNNNGGNYQENRATVSLSMQF